MLNSITFVLTQKVYRGAASGATWAQILVTLGAQNALYLVNSTLVNSDKHVVIESPTYPDLRDILLQRTKLITGLSSDSRGLILGESVLRHADSVIHYSLPSMPNNAPCQRPGVGNCWIWRRAMIY